MCRCLKSGAATRKDAALRVLAREEALYVTTIDAVERARRIKQERQLRLARKQGRWAWLHQGQEV